MSAKTPTSVLQQLVANRNHDGVIMPTKDFRSYMLDLNGWFMWQGEMYAIDGRSIGAGLTRATCRVKYPIATSSSTETP